MTSAPNPREPESLATIRALSHDRPMRALAAGEVVFRCGDPGSELYGIVSGRIGIEHPENGSRESLMAGHCFGIGALVDPSHRRYETAWAETDSKLLVMNREEFLLAVQELPMFGLELLHDLDLRLRQLRLGSDPSDGLNPGGSPHHAP